MAGCDEALREARAAAGQTGDKQRCWRRAGESAREALLAVARHGGAAAMGAEVAEGAAGLTEVARCLREEGLLPPATGAAAAPALAAAPAPAGAAPATVSPR